MLAKDSLSGGQAGLSITSSLQIVGALVWVVRQACQLETGTNHFKRNLIHKIHKLSKLFFIFKLILKILIQTVWQWKKLWNTLKLNRKLYGILTIA